MGSILSSCRELRLTGNGHDTTAKLYTNMLINVNYIYKINHIEYILRISHYMTFMYCVMMYNIVTYYVSCM